MIDASTGVPAEFNLTQNGDLYLSRAWSVTADLGYQFTPSLVGHVVGSYASYRSPQTFIPLLNTVPGINFLPGDLPGLVDFHTWSLTGNMTYTITKGLTIAGEVSYEERKYDKMFATLYNGLTQARLYQADTNIWAVGLRLKRSF